MQLYLLPTFVLPKTIDVCKQLAHHDTTFRVKKEAGENLLSKEKKLAHETKTSYRLEMEHHSSIFL
jgi:hypothetical protein